MGVLNLMTGQKAAASNMARSGVNSVSSVDMGDRSSNLAQMWTRCSVGNPDHCPRAGWEEGEADDRCSMAHGGQNFLDTQISKLQEFHDKQMADDKESKKLGNLDTVMGAAIILNVLWIAFEIDWGPEHGDPPDKRVFWMFGNTCFLLAFMVEIAVRMHVERSRWKYGPWNWFDTIVVALGTADVWILTFVEGSIGKISALSTLRIVRLVRLVRMIKLVKNLNSLYVILMAFSSAARSMVFLVIIMFFGMLVYAIFTTLLIGQNSSFDDVLINGDTVEHRFGKVYRSMYSLFELMTLEGWEQVARPLVEKQPAVFLIIGSFIMIFTSGLLNMVVATVVEKTMQQSAIMKQQQGRKKEKSDMLKTLRELEIIKELFSNGASEEESHAEAISRKCFEEAVNGDEKFKKAFEGMGVPLKSASDLLTVLELESEDTITVNELFNGIAKIQGGGISTWDTMYTFASVKKLNSDICDVKNSLATFSQWTAAVDARLERQDSMLQELLNRTSCRSPPKEDDEIMEFGSERAYLN